MDQRPQLHPMSSSIPFPDGIRKCGIGISLSDPINSRYINPLVAPTRKEITGSIWYSRSRARLLHLQRVTTRESWVALLRVHAQPSKTSGQRLDQNHRGLY